MFRGYSQVGIWVASGAAPRNVVLGIESGLLHIKDTLNLCFTFGSPSQPSESGISKVTEYKSGNVKVWGPGWKNSRSDEWD